VNNQKKLIIAKPSSQNLNEYAMDGFLNLLKELVETMLRSGLSWDGKCIAQKILRTLSYLIHKKG
jgi:hypothetical protein